jgi:hypothetical protein
LERKIEKVLSERGNILDIQAEKGSIGFSGENS